MVYLEIEEHKLYIFPTNFVEKRQRRNQTTVYLEIEEHYLYIANKLCGETSTEESDTTLYGIKQML